jgi:pimeloyl-ACP methyl ester carboxylesterase
MNPSRGTTILLALVQGALVACSDARSAAEPDAGERPSPPVADASTGDVELTQIHVGELVFDARVAGPEDGELVLLLHGFPETSYEWRFLLPVLARAGYRAVAFDQRGYSPGARPGDVADYGILSLIGDVVGVADALGAKRFHLIGHDWGGGVAWGLAATLPDRVITLDIASVPHPDALQAQLSDKSSCQYQASAYFDTFTSPGAASTLLAADAGSLRGLYGDLPAADVAIYLRALGDEPAMTAALDWYSANIEDRQFVLASPGTVHVPTLLAWGDHDVAFCRDTVELTAAHVDGPYRLEVFEGVDHWVPEKGADKYDSIVLEHIRAFQ